MAMDSATIISKLETPEECAQLAENVRDAEPELAKMAIRRGIEMKAETKARLMGAKSQVEVEALRAVYAYEEVLFRKHGKHCRASRTWQAIRTRNNNITAAI